jgi:hypothetical protein
MRGEEEARRAKRDFFISSIKLFMNLLNRSQQMPLLAARHWHGMNKRLEIEIFLIKI